MAAGGLRALIGLGEGGTFWRYPDPGGEAVQVAILRPWGQGMYFLTCRRGAGEFAKDTAQACSRCVRR